MHTDICAVALHVCLHTQYIRSWRGIHALRTPLRKHILAWPPVCSPRQHTMSIIRCLFRHLLCQLRIVKSVQCILCA